MTSVPPAVLPGATRAATPTPTPALPPPRLGVAYRRRASAAIHELPEIDCLEVLVEHFLPLTRERRRELEALREKFVLIPHGVALSPGSVQEPARSYFDGVRELIRLIDAPFFGEHASISRAGGYNLHHLSPVWRTRVSLDALVTSLERATDRLGVPIALETITETHMLAGAELAWDEFYVEAALRAGAGLLVDVTNLWVNRENEVVTGLSGLCGRLGEANWHQFHLAGITRTEDGFYVDSHDHALSEDVLAAYREALQIQTAPYAIVERDGRLDQFEELGEDLRGLRRLNQDVRAALP